MNNYMMTPDRIGDYDSYMMTPDRLGAFTEGQKQILTGGVFVVGGAIAGYVFGKKGDNRTAATLIGGAAGVFAYLFTQMSG